MPVRRMAQPLWFFFISAAWLGGAAVAMEARSRLAGDRGGAGQGRPSPGSRAPGGWGAWWGGLGCAGLLLPLGGTGASSAAFVAAASRGACAAGMEALCRRMRSGFQLRPLGWASGSGHRESVLDAPLPIGSPQRSQAPEGSRARAACPYSRPLTRAVIPLGARWLTVQEWNR